VKLRLLVLLALACSCATPGVPRQELPEDPIAVLYWTSEESRRRAEILEQQATGPTRRGVARVDDLGTLLGQRRGGFDALAQWPGRLSLLDPRTGEVERVEAAPPGSRPLSWSHDRRHLLFVSTHANSKPQLYRYERETGDVHALTFGHESHPKGDVGPEGRLVYLGLEKRGESIRSRLYVTGPRAGKPEVLLTGEIPDTPRISPDGGQVIFTRAQPSRGGRIVAPLIVSRPADPLAEPVEKILGRGKDPDFSPGGEWIVYSGRSAGVWRLAKMRPDGTGRTPLGSGQRDEASPTVSPGGRFVAYTAREGEFDLVFVRRMDGSGERPLMEYGSAAWPTW
jgi:dipeptidyl aminopeptidase/acylaminoacyl peptidase